jgi:hypothetical protein
VEVFGLQWNRLYRTAKAKFGLFFTVIGIIRWLADIWGEGQTVKEWAASFPRIVRLLSEPWIIPIVIVLGIGLIFWGALDRGGSASFDNSRWVPERYKAIRIPHEYIVGACVLFGLLVVGFWLHRQYARKSPVPEQPKEHEKEIIEQHETKDGVSVAIHKGPSVKVRATKMALPSAHVQTFDGGPCSSEKYVSDPARGVFSGWEDAVRNCENSPYGHMIAVMRMPSDRWSSVSLMGLTPKKIPPKMHVTLRYITELGIGDPMGKSMVLDMFSACGIHNAQRMSHVLMGSFLLKEPMNLIDSHTVDIPSCKPGETYLLKIARDGERDHLPNFISIVEVEVDMR